MSELVRAVSQNSWDSTQELKSKADEVELKVGEMVSAEWSWGFRLREERADSRCHVCSSPQLSMAHHVPLVWSDLE